MSQEHSLGDPALIAQRPQPTQAEITPGAVEWLFICFAHDRTFFNDALALVNEAHFLPNEEPLKLLWRVLCHVIPTYGAVTYDNLRLTYDQVLRETPQLALTPDQLEIIERPNHDGLLFSVANPPPDLLNAGNISMARGFLQKFLYERSIVMPLRRVVQPTFMGGMPADLPGFLRQIDAQQNRLSSINGMPVANLTPSIDEHIDPSYVFKRTGVSFIDGPLGGQRVGDACGIIGPTGGGKTTAAIYAATTTAKQCYMEYLAGGVKEAVVFVTVEEETAKLRPRIWSNAFQIPRDKLEQLTHPASQLTNRDNLEEYERRLAGENNVANGEILSEIERFQMGSLWLKEHFILLDLSGSDAHPGAGYGYIPEVASYLDRLQQERQISFRSVYLDYAGLLVERHLQASNVRDPERAYRSTLKSFGDEFRRSISERFSATSWILHQLRGDLGTASPTRLMHHSEAGESKDFAVNMAVCACLGTADQRTGCRRWNYSKVRFRAGEQIAPITLRINDYFAKMDDVSSMFTVDEATRQFLSVDDMRAVGGITTATRRSPALVGDRPNRETARQAAPNQSTLASSGLTMPNLEAHENGGPTVS